MQDETTLSIRFARPQGEGPIVARVIDGGAVARRLRAQTADRAAKFLGITSRKPGLGVLLVGNNPASASYVKGKESACAEAGIYTQTIRCSDDSSQNHLIDIIGELNSDVRFDGILVQLPLPPHINEDAVLQAISPDKDVDGLHPYNLGLLMVGTPKFVPATPLGVQRLLLEEKIPLRGANIVICGRSNIVGRPLAVLLMNKGDNANATVTVCHTGTKDLGAISRRADVLIAAMGQPSIITGEMVRPGGVVIDVGVSRVADTTRKRGYRLVGDVDFESVAKKASLITPVPGGVGPMTIAMLLNNVMIAARTKLSDTDTEILGRQNA